MYDPIPFDRIAVGARAAMRRTVTEADGALYVAATGDHGPVHVDDGHAAATRFGRRLAPGIMVAGLCTSVLTAELAGTLGVSIEDHFRFTGPVFYGDTLEVAVWIVECHARTRTVVWEGSARNADGLEVLQARATLKYPRARPPAAAA